MVYYCVDVCESKVAAQHLLVPPVGWLSSKALSARFSPLGTGNGTPFLLWEVSCSSIAIKRLSAGLLRREESEGVVLRRVLRQLHSTVRESHNTGTSAFPASRNVRCPAGIQPISCLSLAKAIDMPL